jgi:vacuolar iron transporter family protein
MTKPPPDTLAQHKAAHTPAAIRRRLTQRPEQSYLRDFIYGAIDGAVTTFAVVAGVAGAGLSPVIIIILGAANIVADGFSMAVSNFLGTRADQQLLARARRTEERHIRTFPEGEREEIRQIFARKGFTGDDLERVVEVITSDTQQWVDTMLREELGLAIEVRSPWRAGMMTFVAFGVIGALPLIPFVLYLFGPLEYPFAISAVMTGVAFFIVGAGKSRFVEERWWLAGLETLSIGGIAAVLAYVIGMVLGGLIQP